MTNPRMTLIRRSTLVAVIGFVVLMSVAAHAFGPCDHIIESGCCPSKQTEIQRAEPKGAVNFDLILDVYACIKEIIDNLLAGNLKFPKTCCKLPILNIVCSRSNRLLGYNDKDLPMASDDEC